LLCYFCFDDFGPPVLDYTFGGIFAIRTPTVVCCSFGGILEKFGWFGEMLKEFVREKHYSG